MTRIIFQVMEGDDLRTAVNEDLHVEFSGGEWRVVNRTSDYQWQATGATRQKAILNWLAVRLGEGEEEGTG